MDIDLLIHHETPDKLIPVQYGEQVLTHGGNADAVLDFPVEDLQVEGEVGVLSVINRRQLDLAERELLPLIYGLL